MGVKIRFNKHLRGTLRLKLKDVCTKTKRYTELIKRRSIDFLRKHCF